MHKHTDTRAEESIFLRGKLYREGRGGNRDNYTPIVVAFFFFFFFSLWNCTITSGRLDREITVANECIRTRESRHGCHRQGAPLPAMRTRETIKPTGHIEKRICNSRSTVTMAYDYVISGLGVSLPCPRGYKGKWAFIRGVYKRRALMGERKSIRFCLFLHRSSNTHL